jgi:hypothetical protein
MPESDQKTGLVDATGRPAREAIDTRCPRCRTECPKGDERKRVRSGGFGAHVHDVCVTCGYDFEELTV